MLPKLPPEYVFVDGKTTESYIKVPGIYPVIDRLYESISAVQAYAKFKTEVGIWEEACESYLLFIDKELANEAKFNSSKQDNAFELGEIKDALARLVEGITMSVVELEKKIRPQGK
jgi:hypothetical protein